MPGEDLPHVSHYYDEAHPYYRQRVVIVGGKNSAAEAALELFRAGAHVTLVHRRPALGESIKYWVKPDIENRIKEGAIAARFNATVREIRPTEVVVEAGGLPDQGQADDAGRHQHEEGGDPAQDLALGGAAGGEQAPVLGGEQLRLDARRCAARPVLARIQGRPARRLRSGAGG